MPLVVLPATIPDIRAIYDVYFAAFKGHLILDVLFPSGVTPEFREAHTAHTLEWWKQTTLQHTFKCVDTETSEIVGMATWEVFWKERSKEEWKAPCGVEWLEGKERERAEEILRPLWLAKERLWEGRPFVYCQILAVHPNHQRRGVGKLLMQWGLQTADQLHVPIYLESSHSGLRMYESLGFRTLTCETVVHKPAVTHEKEDITVPLMARLPGSHKDRLTYEEWRELGFPPDYARPSARAGKTWGWF
ncbi:Puromycin N-acetyltransferase 1 [Phlyctema vagabunda]|uniref:Puromycin N-acetyltransferase 1 n=1 Tax=Phlyctema vagabunda TaxID=108571 RepID=A0ABR4P4Z6_9HELO